MDPRMKRLTEELSAAINESIAQSEAIAEVIARIQNSGYNVFLFLNATIGLRPTAEDSVCEPVRSDGEVESGFSSQDVKFLKSLHISVKE